MIQCKRVYDEVAATDGRRVLVDRLWPRGCSKATLQLDAWLREPHRIELPDAGVLLDVDTEEDLQHPQRLPIRVISCYGKG